MRSTVSAIVRPASTYILPSSCHRHLIVELNICYWRLLKYTQLRTCSPNNQAFLPYAAAAMFSWCCPHGNGKIRNWTETARSQNSKPGWFRDHSVIERHRLQCSRKFFTCVQLSDVHSFSHEKDLFVWIECPSENIPCSICRVRRCKMTADDGKFLMSLKFTIRRSMNKRRRRPNFQKKVKSNNFCQVKV